MTRSTTEIIKLFVLCGSIGFAAMTLAHMKFTADMAENWEVLSND